MVSTTLKNIALCTYYVQHCYIDILKKYRKPTVQKDSIPLSGIGGLNPSPSASTQKRGFIYSLFFHLPDFYYVHILYS